MAAYLPRSLLNNKCFEFHKLTSYLHLIRDYTESIRKGNDEINGKVREGVLSKRGRKKTEHHIPNLLVMFQVLW
jgi:hypothetical protein